MKILLTLIVLIGTAILVLPQLAASKGHPVRFRKIVLDREFRSEGVAIGDINRDGKMDVFAGNLWYEAPDWKPHELAPAGRFDAAGGYSNSFVNFAQDINHDGLIDQILIDTPGKPPVLWRENPGPKAGSWKEHLIAANACNESPTMGLFSGAGKTPFLIFAIDNTHMAWWEPSKDFNSPFQMHPVSLKSPASTAKADGVFKYSHGLGVGDVNGDGRNDILVNSGYWEAPADPRTGPWKFVKADLGDDCAQMYVYDVNGDGLNDVITSSAHGIGIWWYEQQRRNGKMEFIKHVIDESFSQSHALVLADINGDGLPDLVTGKRFWAHGPKGDINPEAPAVLYWFESKRTGKAVSWIPHRIDDDSGVGTQFEVGDINGDKLPDIAISNKKGVFVFLQEK